MEDEGQGEAESDLLAIIHKSVSRNIDTEASPGGENDGLDEEGEEEEAKGAVEVDDTVSDNMDGNNDASYSDDDLGSSDSVDGSIRPVADIQTEEVPQASTQTFVVTAYSAGVESTGKAPGDAGYGVTASGETVREGHTLACPPSMAFGTVVSIEGIGDRVCADRGSAITEGRLDVYMESVQAAIEFGRQTLEVTVH